MKDRYGKQMKNERGETLKIPGALKSVKAMGVFLERCNIAQVSVNLVDYGTTSMHDVFEEVKKQAWSLNIEATGSELVGLAPLEALLKAGRFYAGEEKLTETQLVSLAIDKLGLSRLQVAFRASAGRIYPPAKVTEQVTECFFLIKSQCWLGLSKPTSLPIQDLVSAGLTSNCV